MIKKYPWHFIYLLFIIICLANIFQKINWSQPSDGVIWQETSQGLVAVDAPKDHPIKVGDILFTLDKYIISNNIDLQRVISQKRSIQYEVERRDEEGLGGKLEIIVVDITSRFTPFSYYILVIAGIILILLTLGVLNTSLKLDIPFRPSPLFYILSLSFSGFLIFSPTSSYNFTDFVYLGLDRIAYIFFPALLLHFSLFHPIKSLILKKINRRLLMVGVYIIPSTILLLNAYFLLMSVLYPITEILTLTINYFRRVSSLYFGLFLVLSMIILVHANLKLIIIRNQRRYIWPLVGILLSFPGTIISHIFPAPDPGTSSFWLNLTFILIIFMPLCLVYFLSHRRFSDIENIIRKTLSISSILLFIFGIYFFIGHSIEQNKLIGVFWSLAAILTAGFLFKPIEATVLKAIDQMRQFFFKNTFNFKTTLRELIQSIQTERDLSSLASNFTEVINKGLDLEKSMMLIHRKKNLFISLPDEKKVVLSKTFQNQLYERDYLSLVSGPEFSRKYPKDFETMNRLNVNQFLPLKVHHQLIGLVAFSQKRNKTLLSVEDWELIMSVSGPLAIAVENAFLYSELESQLTEINLLKEFNENIIENVNLGIVVLSKMNIINTWNNFMEYKFKILRENAINQKGQSILGQDLWKKIYHINPKSHVLNNINKEIAGEVFTFDIYISPLKDRADHVMGTILVIDDITERVGMQNKLITSEKMASIGLLSAGIAHEINTPLTGISSYCQFILENPKDPENIDLVMKISDQVQRANKITRSLLDFSRQKGEDPVEIDFGLCIDESISLMEHGLKKKRIQLSKEIKLKSKLFGYRTRIQQMFINILINSSDAIDHDHGVIKIAAEELDDSILITIKDNGKGMSDEEMDQIFEPFFTTKDRGKGTGLGLSIVYNIMKEHYGDIDLKSTPGQGSQFSLIFPSKSPLRRMFV